jgi:hypothetical protein
MITTKGASLAGLLMHWRRLDVDLCGLVQGLSVSCLLAKRSRSQKQRIRAFRHGNDPPLKVLTRRLPPGFLNDLSCTSVDIDFECCFFTSSFVNHLTVATSLTRLFGSCYFSQLSLGSISPCLLLDNKPTRNIINSDTIIMKTFAVAAALAASAAAITPVTIKGNGLSPLDASTWS